MGCNEVKEKQFPMLTCLFQLGNEEQQNYCIKIKDNFKHPKTIRFEIRSGEGTEFCVKFKLNNVEHTIQDKFDNSEEALNTTLQKMYKLLNEDIEKEEKEEKGKENEKENEKEKENKP